MSFHPIPSTPTSNAVNQPVRLGETAIDVIAQDLIMSMRGDGDSFIKVTLAEQVSKFKDLNNLGVPLSTTIRSMAASPSTSTRLLHEYAAIPYYPGRRTIEAQGDVSPLPPPPAPAPAPAPAPQPQPQPLAANQLDRGQKLLNLLVYLHQKVQFFPKLQGMVRMRQEDDQLDLLEIEFTIHNILAKARALRTEEDLVRARWSLNSCYAAKEGLREKIAGWKILADDRIPGLQDLQEMSDDD